MKKSSKEYIAKQNKESMKKEPAHRLFNSVSDKGFNFTSYRQDGEKVTEEYATKECQKHLSEMKETAKSMDIITTGKGKGSDTEQYARVQVLLK